MASAGTIDELQRNTNKDRLESAGTHIVMDARVSDASVFDPKVLAELFRQLLQTLAMKPMGDLIVYEVPVNPAILERAKATGLFEDEGGISTIQVITTSHMALHAWPLQKYFAFDGFSCKNFDAKVALEIIRSILGVTVERTLVLQRNKPHEKESSQVTFYEC